MDSHPHSSDPDSDDYMPSIPTHSREPATLRCCCARNDCAILEHNSVALEAMEKDLATAARLGQALLHRHESYVSQAEEDRQLLAASIEALELEKSQVQIENMRIVEENHSLLEQLETINKTASESDDRIHSLTQTLARTEEELRHLNAASVRAAELEDQLNQMEAEHLRIQERLEATEEDERAAVNRWRSTENRLRDLTDQVEHVEAEGREERARHEEIFQRMERKRQVERELDHAAGRLKGAAAASEITHNPRTHVVSRFVKDILQDNANLQVGIMELRQMLDSSNYEVQNLREQVMCDQPLPGVDDENEHVLEPISSSTLSEELHSRDRVSQEFHIHHHFHTSSPKKDKGPWTRRVKKKRPAVGNTIPLNLSMRNPPLSRNNMHRSQPSGSSMNTILSQTSVSIPPSSRRWSAQSSTFDSRASSPQSAFRTSSIFDRMDVTGYSQATSPDSTVFTSPMTGVKALDRDSRSMGDYEEQYDRSAFSDMYEGIPSHAAIPEESEASPSGYYLHSAARDSTQTNESNIFGIHTPYKSLRKSSSHDSLLSIAGMDIHTPTNRYSSMGDWHSGIPIPRRLMAPSVELASTPPIISTATITANLARRSEQSSRSLLASMAASSIPSEFTSAISPDSASISTSSTATPTPNKKTLRRRMGGWVMGKWGVAPVSEEDDAEDSTTQSEPQIPIKPPNSKTSTPKNTPRPPPGFRHPGVNQKGPIMGFYPPPQAPISIHAEDIDEELLRESLAE
ncbi:hypothetical protein N7495_007257 [Penicillium taxi]|uniref:uncharacterized protein n=1 Tax=Penicillium taxi TaxID=168475 RepID=UPI002545AB83|nr:uncharacterized protein N7495_007257 [Penicillium taxi]KAJ5895566.1 hypothetical protein N7495_007257 [Penicillium taxi]